MDHVYEKCGDRPLRMAFFWENVLRNADKDVIPPNTTSQFKPSNIVNNSGKYQTFRSTPNNTLYVRKIGQEALPSPEVNLKNFRGSVIKAFITPLNEDKNRFFVTDPKCEYKDMNTDASPTNGIPIERKFLLSNVESKHLSEENKRDLIKRIKDWAHAYSVPDRIIYFSKIARNTSVTLYDRMIKSLDEGDLARISMPLDIVKKLMNADQ